MPDPGQLTMTHICILPGYGTGNVVSRTCQVPAHHLTHYPKHFLVLAPPLWNLANDSCRKFPLVSQVFVDHLRQCNLCNRIYLLPKAGRLSNARGHPTTLRVTTSSRPAASVYVRCSSYSTHQNFINLSLNLATVFWEKGKKITNL